MEGLFTDADRQALRACGAALAPDTIARQFQEDYLCYIALTRSSGKLYLSYISRDEQGRDLKPSPLLRRVAELFPSLSVQQAEPFPASQLIGGEICLLYTSRLIPYLPQIILPHEEKAWAEMISSWKSIAIDAVVANNLGQYSFLHNLGWQKTIYAGMGFNCFNSRSCSLLSQMQFQRVTLSPEMTMEQLRQLRNCGLETRCV